MSWAPIPRPGGRGNKPGTPYEPCFTPLDEGRTTKTEHLEQWTAPKAVLRDAFGVSEGPFYRVFAIRRHSDGENMKEGTVSQAALAWTVDRWSRLDDLYCVMIQPL